MLLMATMFSSCGAKTLSIDEAVLAIKNLKPGKSITIVLDANTTEITDELKDALSDYSYLDDGVIGEIENITSDYGYDASIKFLQKYVKKVNLDLSKTKLTEILEKTFGDMDRGGCINLANVTIPSSVTSIEEEAFFCCSLLANVNIPNSVISIGDKAFYDCYSLTSMTIPSSVISIGDEAFYGCSNLTISVAESNSFFSSKDGALYNKDKTILISWPSASGSVTIPNSVIYIGDEAFYGCKSLTSVTIPNSVISIGDHAFLSCSSLKSVTIPSSVKSIGWFAFSFCSSLTSAIIPYELSSAVDKQFVFDDNVIIYTK